MRARWKPQGGTYKCDRTLARTQQRSGLTSTWLVLVAAPRTSSFTLVLTEIYCDSANRARARHHLQGLPNCHQTHFPCPCQNPLVLISIPSLKLLNPDPELELEDSPGQARELVERQPQSGPSPSPPLPPLLPPAPSQITVISGQPIISVEYFLDPPKTDPNNIPIE